MFQVGKLFAVILLLSLKLGAEPVSFRKQIAPIFQQHCVGCHKEGKAKGKYRMDTFVHGAEEWVAGDTEDSELFYRITTDDKDDRMPAEADPLAADEIALIKRWIEEGAKYDGEDPKALLSTIVPMVAHPKSPDNYPRALPVTALTFAAEGQELVSGGYHELLVWKPESGELLRRITNNGQRTYGLSLSPDGTLIAAATGAPGQAGEVRVFEYATGKVIATPFRGDDNALSVAFSPDGSRLVIGAADGRLRVVQTSDWKTLIEVTAHSDWITAVAWNKEGTQVATASRDHTAKVFDLTKGGKRIITFSGHSKAVRGVAFHPASDQVISCGDKGMVYRWKVSDGKKSGDLANLGGAVLRLAKGESAYVVSAPEGMAVQFQLADQKRVRDLRVEESSSVSIGALALFGEILAVGYFDGRVEMLELKEGKALRGFSAKP